MAKKKKKKVSKKKTENKKNRNKKKSVNKKTPKKTTQKTKSNVKSAAVKNKNVKSSTKSKTTTKKKTNEQPKKNKEIIVEEKSPSNVKPKLSKEKKAVNKKEVNKRKINKALIRKIFISLFIILCITLVILFIKLMNDKKTNNNVEFENINFEEYLNLYSAEELQFVYLMNNTCIDCYSYEININKLQVEYKLNIKKFDFSNLNEEDIEKLKSSSPSLSDGIEMPIILSIKNGNEINHVSGIKEYSVLQKFAQNSLNPTESNSFEKISVDKYLSLLNSKDTTFIYIGNPSNSGCKTFTPILENVAQERKLKVYYLNTDNMNTSNDWDKLENSSEIFEDVWFMPTVLVIKNSKIKDYKMETMNQKDLEKFLKKNGL